MRTSEWASLERQDDNMIIRLDWPRKKDEFLHYLESQTVNIQKIVSYHLSLPRHQQCFVGDRSTWMSGSYNVCIPIKIPGHEQPRLIFRCPFPHRFETAHPGGLLEEKVRCEAATFAWISKNCPRIPIPRLWGAGLPNGICFTPLTRISWYRRICETISESLRNIWRGHIWRPFVAARGCTFASGYLLMDMITEDQGVLLSKKWPPESTKQKAVFLESLAEIMLDLALPLEKIGSFTVTDNGEVSLSNRPLTSRLAVLENNGVPSGIPQSTCYATTETYVSDLLRCHDERLQYQPNASRDCMDAQGQMAMIVALRALSLIHTRKDLRNGPFCMSFTDLHPNNIFVKENFEIAAIIDLEFSCSQPMEMLSPPLWLTGMDLDDLLSDEMPDAKRKDAEKPWDELFEVLEAKENETKSSSRVIRVCDVMRTAIGQGSHWYFQALHSTRMAYSIFMALVQPLYDRTQTDGDGAINFQRIATPYWQPNALKLSADFALAHTKYIETLRAKR
ncbi:hypothetical protein AC578_10464 [Pseudocercospora eumusae]|uniref:Uncharacterized protein n=1 Tax=Pseudocercospora eumusae TaxID=321146 RepID=A0A139GYQ2_9PEZI|nr:hypothetical protein AC578_10464 [Pseudocercospora eumusae]